MPVETKNLDAVIARINRKYERNLIHAAAQVINPGFITTGSPELDVAMGGGVPRGRFTRFYGGFGSTKTMTALYCIAAAQQLGLVCVYFNIEKRFEKEFAKRIGIDVDKLIVVEGTSIEEIGEKFEALLSVANFFVLDSCSIAVSEDELECDVRDWRPGINARVWGKVFRRINERFDPVDNTAILIDQVRVDFKTGGENPAGGRVFDHQSSMSVLFSKGKWLYLDDEGILSEDAKKTKGSDGQTTPDGREIKIRVEKSSVCRPFRTATLHYNLDTLEYDRLYEYVKAAKHYGVIVPSPGGGNGRWEYIDGDGNVQKLYGDKQIRNFIKGNDDLQQYIADSAFEAIDMEEARRGR
jgi:recombination protein RecA